MDFEKFKNFWFGEAEQKLLRCSKELGVYKQIRKVLNPNDKQERLKHLFDIYIKVKDELFSRGNDVIIFSYPSTGKKKEFSTKLALEDERHFSQVFVFALLNNISCDFETFENVCKMYDNSLYKGHKTKAFFEEKLSLIKLLLK